MSETEIIFLYTKLKHIYFPLLVFCIRFWVLILGKIHSIATSTWPRVRWLGSIRTRQPLTVQPVIHRRTTMKWIYAQLHRQMLTSNWTSGMDRPENLKIMVSTSWFYYYRWDDYIIKILYSGMRTPKPPKWDVVTDPIAPPPPQISVWKWTNFAFIITSIYWYFRTSHPHRASMQLSLALVNCSRYVVIDLQI